MVGSSLRACEKAGSSKDTVCGAPDDTSLPWRGLGAAGFALSGVINELETWLSCSLSVSDRVGVSPPVRLKGLVAATKRAWETEEFSLLISCSSTSGWLTEVAATRPDVFCFA